MKAWFTVKNKVDDPSTVDVFINQLIGDWIDDYYGLADYGMVITANSFIKALSDLPKDVQTINVHINSPGGDVFSAVTIANALRDQQLTKKRNVDTYVTNAFSAATVIAMAGKNVHIADNGVFMIHNPWTVAMGEAKDMQKAADELATVRAQIIATYKWHSELSDDEIVALMDASTWMSADEAVSKGFATNKLEGLPVQAALDPRIVAKLNVPERFKAVVMASAAKTDKPVKPVAAAPAEVVRECGDTLPQDEVAGLIEAGATLDEVRAKVTAARTARAAATARAEEITAICKGGRIEEFAAGFISSNISIDTVKDHVLIHKAKASGPPIDGSLPPDGTTPRQRAALDNLNDTYKRLNQPATSAKQ